MTLHIESIQAIDERLDALTRGLDAIVQSGDITDTFMADDLTRIRAATEDLRSRIAGLGIDMGTRDWSRVRHDLRTPLNHILGYGEMLQQDAEEAGLPAVSSRLAEIVSTGRDILKQTDDIITIARKGVTPRPVPRRGSGVQGVSGQILVVDDDAGNRDLLRRRLERRGHQVLTASSGAEALAAIETAICDVVLLDLVMPDMDGAAVLSKIRADRRSRSLPVVMLSGMKDLDAVVRCIELGADDYLTKPFEEVLLNARIGACLEKKRLRDREQDLLRVLFPDPVVEELLTTGRVAPRRFDDVAVMFGDLVGFTAFGDKREPEEVVAALQDLVGEWERLTNVHGLQKVKTIGDSVMVVGNMHQPHDNAALACAKCGLDFIKSAAASGHGWDVRVGIHVGPVVAGVLGKERYQYDLWGDTVNTASRAESHGLAGSVVLSSAAWARISEIPGANAEFIGAVRMKGKGGVELHKIVSLP